MCVSPLVVTVALSAIPAQADEEAPSTESVTASTSAKATQPTLPENADAQTDKDGEHRILMLNLEAVGISADTARMLGSLVAQTIALSTSVELMTAQDLSSMVDLEADRQATGCASTSCLAEVAGAMGTRYVVFGSVGRVGDFTLVELNLFDSHDAKPMGHSSPSPPSYLPLLSAISKKFVRERQYVWPGYVYV